MSHKNVLSQMNLRKISFLFTEWLISNRAHLVVDHIIQEAEKYTWKVLPEYLFLKDIGRKYFFVSLLKGLTTHMN